MRLVRRLVAALLAGWLAACSDGSNEREVEAPRNASSPAVGAGGGRDARASFLVRSEKAAEVEVEAEPALPRFDPDAEGVISGPAKVLDTGNLLVGLSVAPLFGVSGVEGEAVVEFQRWIDENGGGVTCSPMPERRFVCRTEAGRDVGAVALELGAARVAPAAPEAYRRREASAREAALGIWGS